MSPNKLWFVPTIVLAAALAGSGAVDAALVKAQTLSLREKRSRSAKRLETLRTYEPLKISVREGEWARVESTAGNVGWVLTSYLTSNSFVSVNVPVNVRKLNVRQGPGTNYPVIMRVIDHYPLRVIDRASGWLMVMDYDGDRGWVSQNLVSWNSYVITTLEECNLRDAPGTESNILFTADRGVLLKVLKQKDGWLHVRHEDGDEAWVSAKIVFGWLDSSGAQPKKSSDAGGESGRAAAP